MLFFLFILVLISSRPALAISEFTLNQNVTYTINQSGNASVVEDLTLTNNLSEIYAKEYRLTLSDDNLKNITGNDDFGNIIQNIQSQNGQTLISLKFNQPALGKDKTTRFKLRYTIDNFAENKGKVWEISLPQYQNLKEKDTVKVTLFSPSFFGDLAYSSVPPISKNQSVSQNEFSYQINPSQNQKILLILGNYQIFDFDLTYQLKNDENEAVQTEIAFPPDTNNQLIIFKKIIPPPENIIIDSDGNWLGKYLLSPSQELTISATGQVKIIPATLKPSPLTNPNSLLEEKPFWPVTHPQITAISQKLKNPQQIYDYVVSSLSYNYDLINSPQRKGALVAINSPQDSVCTEFTDLFVTLSRSKGIPAREIEGFAYTNNPKIKPTNLNADVLHAWPQYYNSIKQAWIDIDPTWGKTTNGIDYFRDLDLNHFTFVIHGQDSSYPPPPGAYKTNKNFKTVLVDFAKTELKPSYSPPVVTPIKTGLNRIPKIILQNQNPNSLNAVTVFLSANDWSRLIEKIPPYSSVEITIPPISFFQSLLPKNQKITFQFQFEGSPDLHRQSITYLPHYLNLGISLGILIILLCLGGIIILTPKKHFSK
ncbi:MAG: transglutaminase domain-containing protein [Candidatus Shapirobacteria bacterium]